MKILASLALALLSTSAFASLPEGQYSGRCDGASTMQKYQNGKAVDEGMALSFYQLLDLSVTKAGDATIETMKMKIYGEQGPDGDEFETSTKVESAGPNLVKKTSLTPGGSTTVYRVDADGSEVWIQSIDKDGKVSKADSTSVSFVTKENVEISSAFNNQTGKLKDKNFSGWALADSKIFCRIAPAPSGQ